MATSDSEDFESADEEWDIQTDKLRDHKENSTTVNQKLEFGINKPFGQNLEQDVYPCLDPKTDSVVEPKTDAVVRKTVMSGDGDSEKEVDSLVKSIERDARIENESLPPENTLNTEKSLIEKCDDENMTKSEIKVLRENLVVKNECKKSIAHDVNDINLESKEMKSVLKEKYSFPTTEPQTDGWECEDEDLDEDLIENSNGKPEIGSALKKLSESVEKEKQVSESESSGWGNWGVTSLLWTAAESVSTISNQVSQGLSSVLETGLGVPEPEELAKQEIEQEKKLLTSLDKDGKEENENVKEQGTGLIGLGHVISGVSSITKLVETAGTKVVSGGLDTLETIGKKTMEVLQEGDPGLRKKRAIFSEKVVLSQILREAKEKGEQEDRALRNTEEARKVHFETLFDDYHGLVHLEALEMLSKQCNIKLQSILLNTSPSDLPELQQSIAEIKDLCELPDEEDNEGESFETLESKLADVGKGLGVPIANEKLVKSWQEIHRWIEDCRSKQTSTGEESSKNVDNSAPTAQEIHQKAIGSLAKLTAEAVEQFHKTAELLLVYDKRKPSDEAKILLDMTTIFSLQVSTAATAFSVNLNTSSEYAANSDAINSQITNVFLEAANSSSYIQEAFQLLIPVLQVGLASS